MTVEQFIMDKKGEIWTFIEMEIIRALQSQGGTLSKEKLVENIRINTTSFPSEFVDHLVISKKTGKPYNKFLTMLGFSIKSLKNGGILISLSRGVYSLTEIGLNFNVESVESYRLDLAPYKEIIDKAWAENSVKNAERRSKVRNPFSKTEQDEIIEDEIETALQEERLDYEDQFKQKLLESLSKFEPKKFEIFARALVNKMGVTLDESKGTTLSNDSGIDGFGYIVSDEFRTARVAIQAKRWSGMEQLAPLKLIS